jgi:hypothetical protein
MFVYLVSVEDRLRAQKIVKVPYFSGPTKEVEFTYGLANVASDLADYLVDHRLATKDFRSWGATVIGRGVSLAAAANAANAAP